MAPKNDPEFTSEQQGKRPASDLPKSSVIIFMNAWSEIKSKLGSSM